MIQRRALFQSPRESCLSPAARLLKLELLSIYNGRNNGELFLSVRDATHRLGFSDFRVAAAAFEELQATGWITCTTRGCFVRAGEQSRAAAWRLNWIGEKGRLLNEDELPPTDLSKLSAKSRKRLERRQKVLKRYHRDRQAGKYSVEDSATLLARRVEETTTLPDPDVEETTTLGSENGCFASPASGEESSTHILHHIRSDAPVELVRTQLTEWWRVSTSKERIKLAKQHALDINEMLDFMAGADLPFPKLCAIRSSLRLSRAAA
ncbi:hypothetical protein H8M03_02540 [Sphingomonas sabuli]|uniref:Uncharacterized protein n=1 Tax=Sphingomonas sabuli TaxID=2764186 RepID=A0A7G9L3P8_9SPHN|nr:hypothetical protein [Sphingomonas sabuli]QNM83247.1 hypothetical protein H8M03_02540 [Sphingomonas sabuli]